MEGCMHLKHKFQGHVEQDQRLKYIRKDGGWDYISHWVHIHVGFT